MAIEVFTLKIRRGLTTDVKPTTGLAVGDVWVETDSGYKFYWDGATWILEEAETQNYSEMYLHENTNPTAIQKANVWHLMNGLSQGLLSSLWSFKAGKSLAISAYATSDGGAKTRVTSAGHTMSNGDIVSIANTTNYDGIYVVEQVTTDTFVIPKAFVADDGASVGEFGASLYSVNPFSGGTYMVLYSLSITPSTKADIYEITLYHNAVQCTKCKSQTRMKDITDYDVLSGNNLVNYTANDKICIAIRNLTNSGSVTARYGCIVILRVV